MRHGLRQPAVLPDMVRTLSRALQRLGVTLTALGLITAVLLWDWSRQLQRLETQDIPLASAIQHLIDDVERHQADLRNELLYLAARKIPERGDPGARRITSELRALRRRVAKLPQTTRKELRLDDLSRLSNRSNLWYWWTLEMADSPEASATRQGHYQRVLRMVQALPMLRPTGRPTSSAARDALRRIDGVTQRLQRQLRRFHYRHGMVRTRQHDPDAQNLRAGLATLAGFAPFLNPDQADLLHWITREIDRLVSTAANGEKISANTNPVVALLQVRVQPIEARLNTRLGDAREAALAQIHARVRRSLGEGALIALLIIVALATFIHTWFRLRGQIRVIAQPLGDIAHAMLRFADGETGISIEPSNTREHHMLAECFKRMQVERARADKQLQTSESHLRTILDNTADAIVTAGGSGLIQSFNPAAERLFGYPESEVQGNNLTLLMPKRYRDRHHEKLAGRTATDEPTTICVSGEFSGLRRDGSEFPIHLEITATRLENGRPLYVGVLRDISTRKQAEQAMLEAQQAAEKADRAKSRLLAHLSHEIRTPLNAVLGYCQLAARDLEGMRLGEHTAIDHLRRARASGRHLLSLMDKGLDLNRLEAKHTRVVWEDVNIAACAEDACSMKELVARECGVTLRLQLAPDLPATLRSDASMLRQIMLNLVDNAIKFSPRGGAVDFAVQPQQGHCLIRVTDTGKGIATEAMERIFDPFEQEDDSASRAFGGAGLGLAIVKGFAQLLGGEISVRSEPGQGSCFEVLLRANPTQDLASWEPPPKIDAAAITLTGRRALIVDDNLLNRDLISDFLRGQGMQVHSIPSGHEALQLLSAARFDLILLDLHMPEMDGFETAIRIRARQDCRHVPIFAVSADTYPNTRARAEASGMNDFIAKPVNLDELLSSVHRALASNPESRQTPDTMRIRLDTTRDAETSTTPAPILDISGGIGHVGGKESTYRRLLARFVEQHGTDAEDLRTSTQADDTDGVIKIVHALKGFAGTLGAERLQRAARDLQLALLESGQSCTDLSAEIAALEQLLRDSLDAMRCYLEGDS